MYTKSILESVWKREHNLFYRWCLELLPDTGTGIQPQRQASRSRNAPRVTRHRFRLVKCVRERDQVDDYFILHSISLHLYRNNTLFDKARFHRAQFKKRNKKKWRGGGIYIKENIFSMHGVHE